MLKYAPIYGSILLTVIFVWIIGSTIIGNRRKIRDAAAGRYIRSTCCGSTSTPFGWTQDGWVSTCDECHAWQYLGDDFDNPPPGFELRLNGRTLGSVVSISVDDQISPALARVREEIDLVTGISSVFSRRPSSPLPVAKGPADEGQLVGWPEVTSVRQTVADIRGCLDEIEAEMDDAPLIMPPPPNIGGEGHPPYAGPHYTPETTHGVQTRFVPYDVLRDPMPGAAVHIVGNAACVGPLEVEEGRGHDDSIREEDES